MDFHRHLKRFQRQRGQASRLDEELLGIDDSSTGRVAVTEMDHRLECRSDNSEHLRDLDSFEPE